MKYAFLNIISLLALSASASAGVIDSELKIGRDFNAHDSAAAKQYGFPVSPTIVSVKLTRQTVLSPLVAVVKYQESQNGPVLSVQSDLQILEKSAGSAKVQVLLKNEAIGSISCGPVESRRFVLTFVLDLQGEFANAHRFVGLREFTEDNCHAPFTEEQVTYKIDE